MKKSVHPSTNNNILWDQNFNFHEFNKLLGPNDIVLRITPDDKPDAWGFYRKWHSTTLFSIEKADGMYVLSMDNFASYDDYRFFLYLLDTLNSYLIGSPYKAEDGKNAFQEFDEEWAEYCIGEDFLTESKMQDLPSNPITCQMTPMPGIG